MRVRTLLILLLLLRPPYFALSDGREVIFLKKIAVEGNYITKEKYIFSYITLNSGKFYDIEKLMDEINASKENLENTNLFTNVFFNDELDEEGNLILTIHVKEKNYFLFGPSGYLGYQNKGVYAKSSIYLTYNNLLGNASNLSFEIPFFEDTGIAFHFQGKGGKIRNEFFFEYLYHDPVENTLNIAPEIAFELKKDHYLGVKFFLKRQTTSTFLFYPFIETGYNERYLRKIKRWNYFFLSPYVGYHNSSSYLYGVESQWNLYRDLFLSLVYSLKLNINFQGGDLSPDLYYRTKVRGTNPEAFRGDKLISSSSGLDIPLPWNKNIVIVPFLDANLIGFNTLRFLMGGGIGVHWYKKYQSPLILELAFGKGLMLNFQKRY